MNNRSLIRRIRNAFIKPSTLSFIREGRRTPRYSLFDMVHGYVYARWPYLYIGVAVGEHPLARTFAPLARWYSKRFPPRPSTNGTPKKSSRPAFADTYHGKVMPLKAAARLVTVNQDVTLKDLEHVIPYTTARDLILKNPEHIAVLECPCRSSRKKPCLPLDVCLIVGEPFASFVEEHHPRRSRRITTAEAVEILRAEDERGHVHHAFFKDAMYGRFYAICNCCSCCCGAMQAHRHGTPMLASSGYIVEVNREKCTGCGNCETSCQFGAIQVEEKVKHVDLEKCMGCGVCVPRCENHAINLRSAPQKGVPLEIDRLLVQAAAAKSNVSGDQRKHPAGMSHS